MVQDPISYYQASSNLSLSLDSLQQDRDCDVCVIGAGYTGLSTALHLSQRGYKVIVLEAQTVGWGASGRNGGQLCTGQRLQQDELETQLGNAAAQQLWHLGQAAKQKVKTLVQQYQIDCDLQTGLIHAGHRKGDAKELQLYAHKLQTDYAYTQIQALTQTELQQRVGSKNYYGGYHDADAGHLHPLNYALGLAKAALAAGAEIYIKSPVIRYKTAKQNHIYTGNFRVRAKHLVLACNGYLAGLEPRISNRIMPINNYILATEPLTKTTAQQLIRDNDAVADSRFVVNYFRLSADRRLLFGGGETFSTNFPSDISKIVRKRMLKIFPQLAATRIDYAWGGTLAVTRSRMPSFGRLKKNIYFAQGYSGQGLAMATLAGELIAEALAGSAERFDVMAKLKQPNFPGGTLLRWPLLALAMSYFAFRDRL